MTHNYRYPPTGTFWICEECLIVFPKLEDAAAHLATDGGWIYEGAYGPDGMGSITWLLTGHEIHPAHYPGHPKPPEPGSYYLNQQAHDKPWEAFARGIIVREFRRQFEKAPI